MKRLPVNSTTLRAVGYDAVKRTLEIEFHNGALYEYENIDRDVYEQLISATSKGRYFDHEIRAKSYPCRLGQGRLNYTNNYDIICYFLKGDRPNTFNLDDIRIPQLVELEHRRRCERVPSVLNGKFGKTKFNDKGKNPGDLWGDIKQLTYKSRELV